MPDTEKYEQVMLLTNTHRILGGMQRGPDGTIWAFKHGGADDFITIHGAQCFNLSDGKRMYDAERVEISRRAVVALFRQQDLAFVRKEEK